MNIRATAAAVVAAGLLVGSTIMVERTVVPDNRELMDIANAVDSERMEDLDFIARRLEGYFRAHGSYPISTYTSDAPIPLAVYAFDLTGRTTRRLIGGNGVIDDPVVEAYWYKSDGGKFVLYARRDGNEFAPCPENDPVPEWDSALCLRGP